MTSIAFLNDTHFGVRNDNEVFLNHQIGFIRDFFIPECKKRNITQVIHLGDVFDKRKNVNIKTLSRVRREVFDQLEKAGLSLTIIAGNHDTYYKNTNEYNSIKELLGDYKNIQIIDQYPEHRGEFGGKHKVLYVPWICQANYDDVMAMLSKSEASVVLGHFEIQGFDMQPGNPCLHGMDRKVLNRFPLVLSGHFHTRSNQGNITYLGTQYEMTWADCQDPKGFNILSDDLKLEFVQYDNPIFIKLLVDGDKATPIKNANFKGKYIKVVVKNAPSDRTKLDAYIDAIRNQEPMDLKIIENTRDYKVEENLDVEVEDTAALINRYVDNLEGIEDTDPALIKSILQELHTEAMEIE